MPQHYTVREFAQMAGVTVRTLHYYDECGLLQPAHKTAANHRLYEIRDLLRLQQILTLKYMGFSLDEINALLQSPVYEIRRSLEIQKAAIDERIAQLQQVSQSLTQTIEAVAHIPDADMDWTQVGAIIRGVSGGHKDEWVQRYYSESALQKLEQRAQTISDETIAQGTEDWRTLMDDFQRLRHLPPDDAQVQALAARMHTLIQAFTGGDHDIRAGMEAMYADFDAIPPQYRMGDRKLYEFIAQAFRIYEDQYS